MNSELTYDAIIVGTGPGGGTVAREMTKRGEKVLILEWGSKPKIKGTVTQALPKMMIPGRSFLFTNGMVGIARGIVTGGSSMFYYGTAFTPPVELFQSYGIDINKEIEETREDIPIDKLPDELMGPTARTIMQSARDLGYNWDKLPKFIDKNKCEAECWRCVWGCPKGAKWSARLFTDEAEENGAQMINGAKVQRVLVEDRAATGVVYTKNGLTRKVYAPKVIVSAGGIGSPQILRNSGLHMAGYDFFYDPLIVVMGTLKKARTGKEIPMSSGLHMEDEGYLMTDMANPRTLYSIFAAQVFKFQKMLAHRDKLLLMVKIKDGLGGRLTEKGGVRKPLTADDKQKLFRGYSRAKDILSNAGAKDIFKSWYIAAHPGGTAKINDVVDTNLMTDIKNLYVCDCSVIPEAWGLPPTFSLICLGKRLVKHLCDETVENQEKTATSVAVLKN